MLLVTVRRKKRKRVISFCASFCHRPCPFEVQFCVLSRCVFEMPLYIDIDAERGDVIVETGLMRRTKMLL